MQNLPQVDKQARTLAGLLQAKLTPSKVPATVKKEPTQNWLQDKGLRTSSVKLEGRIPAAPKKPETKIKSTSHYKPTGKPQVASHVSSRDSSFARENPLKPPSRTERDKNHSSNASFNFSNHNESNSSGVQRPLVQQFKTQQRFSPPKKVTKPAQKLFQKEETTSGILSRRSSDQKLAQASTKIYTKVETQITSPRELERNEELMSLLACLNE